MTKRKKSQKDIKENIEKDTKDVVMQSESDCDDSMEYSDSEKTDKPDDEEQETVDDTDMSVEENGDEKDEVSEDNLEETESDTTLADDRTDEDSGDYENADDSEPDVEQDAVSDDRDIIVDEEYGYDSSDYNEDDEAGYDYTDYDVDDYFEEEQPKRKRHSRLDILDDDYLKEDIKHKTGRKPIALIVAWIVFALLCVSYVYVFFIRKSKTEDIIPGKDNTVVLDIPEDANYRLCDIDEINQLINNYLLARVNCSQTTLKTLVTDPSQFDDMTMLKKAATYLCGYNETTCYIADGYDENGYIVIELSYLKISNVQSQPLDIMSFYVVREADGSYKIDNSELSPEVANYVSTVKATKDIQDIYVHVKENNEYLMDTDSAFADFCNLINK
ncbi:MAG: hypothetical protein ACI4EF_06795 [Coprococcus sp.]